MSENVKAPWPSRLIAPPGRVVFAIGDIHGCLEPLERALSLIEMTIQLNRPQRPLIITLGDYIDRGPNSAGVIERLAGLSGLETVHLMGNHELMLLNFLREPEAMLKPWLSAGGLSTLRSYGIPVTPDMGLPGASVSAASLAKWLETSLPERHREFLSRMQLSYTIGGLFFAHAGARPGIALEDQSPDDLLWIRSDFADKDHAYEKVVIHGHTPVNTVDVRENRVNVDTGAYATGRLSVLVVHEKGWGVLTT
jgi:serine/threonine protein phosphatase 1